MGALVSVDRVTKQEGLITEWNKNGQKETEVRPKDGELISSKYWNNRSEEVDSLEEGVQ